MLRGGLGALAGQAGQAVVVDVLACVTGKPERADEREPIQHLLEVLRRGRPGRTFDAVQGRLVLALGDDKQGVEPFESLLVEALDEPAENPFLRSAPRLPRESLDGREGGGDDLPAPHLFEERFHEDVPGVGALGDRQEPAGELAVGPPVEGAEAEGTHDLGGVLPPRRVAPPPFGSAGVVGEGVRVGADLGGDELHDRAGHGLSGSQGPAGVPEEA